MQAPSLGLREAFEPVRSCGSFAKRQSFGDALSTKGHAMGVPAGRWLARTAEPPFLTHMRSREIPRRTLKL
jgi:hypothetical protein